MHNMDNKTLVLSADDRQIDLGVAVPETARAGLFAAITRTREVQADLGDFARRSLLRMVIITNDVLSLVGSTEGLSKDAAFIEMSRNVEGLSKGALDKWGQVATRLNSAIGKDTDQWSAGAASAAYALTNAGYGKAKDALSGATFDNSDEFVAGVAQAINSNPQVKAVKSSKDDTPTADTINDGPQTVEAFLASVNEAIGSFSGDDLTKAVKGLRAIVNGTKVPVGK